MKRSTTLIIIFVVIITLAIAFTFRTEQITLHPDNYPEKLNTTTVFASQKTTPHQPLGVLITEEHYENEQASFTVTYQPIEGDRVYAFMAHQVFLDTDGVVELALVPYAVHEKGSVVVHLWDAETNTHQVSTTFAEEGFAYRVESAVLSSDAQTLYVVVTNTDRDYNAIWNDLDVSLDQYLINTRLYAVTVADGTRELLDEQRQDQMTYSIEHAGSGALILTEMQSEVEWSRLSIFDVASKRIVYREKAKDLYLSDVSPNGRFLAYVPLLSKAGFFDPADTVLVELTTSGVVTEKVFNDMDWGLTYDEYGQLVTDPWVSWGSLRWSEDNAGLFLGRTTGTMDNPWWTVVHVDLTTQKTELLDTLTDDRAPAIFLGWYRGQAYIKSFEDAYESQVVAYPSEVSLVASNGNEQLYLVLDSTD